MTFDELWRLNLKPRSTFRGIANDLSDVELFDAPVLDDPDEGEIKRFLDWLENDL